MDPEPPSNLHPTVVGIGASARGLASLKAFLARVPEDSGLSFAVVVHLSPDHESDLADLLSPHVRIPIEQVSRTTLIAPNHVYIIPPNANLNVIDADYRLTQLEDRWHERAPINHFFRTLANRDHGPAIAVVLSGTGSDGMLGVKEIKAKGGLVIVQDPVEAEFDDMPQSAIATGLVDFVLPVAEIPETILRFISVRPRLPFVPESDKGIQDERLLLNKVLTQLRVRTGRDFTHYSRSMVLSRIARRMQLNCVEDLPAYLEKLSESSEEVRALADDLLVRVSHFFRDAEVFERLKNVEISRLFAGKGASDTVRAWSVGCATGEEAYSLAMLLAEESAYHREPPRIQVFASDLHSRSLEKAREGFFPGDIAADVSPERLKRFFQQENGGFRVRKEIRDLVLFASHNLLGDPPFSRLDLISCRNFLTDLERTVLQDVMELFHYALNVDGTLVLGRTETMPALDLFRVGDKELCFFRKRNVPPRRRRLPVFPPALTPLRDNGRVQTQAPNSPMVYGNLHHRMLEKYSPPSMLVGGDDKILHLSEHVGHYLLTPGGEPTHSAVKMVREELRIELQAALQHVREKREIYDSSPILVHVNGHASPVVLHVRPSPERDEGGFALVIFEEREPVGPEDPPSEANKVETQQIQALRQELNTARQQLKALTEDYEASKEEMKASNEELQSTNEELRSTMEELEIAKEELQSINQELHTVNQQNRHRIGELGQLSSDLQNLLIATEIATLFLDRDLHILRFTPALGKLFNIRSTDRGRPISDLTHRLGYGDLCSDAEAVLASLVPIERELQDDAGKWFLTRLNPYRSTEDRIEGVVVTFIDITERRDAERMHRAEQKLATETAEVRERYASLTPREREVMLHVVRGHINKIAAAEMHVTETTIKLHRARLMQKMGAESLPELVRMAEKLDLLD